MERVYISADKDGLTGGVQLSIGVEGDDGGGYGYRLAGPKYSGNSETLRKHFLTESDLQELEQYCKLARKAMRKAVKQAA